MNPPIPDPTTEDPLAEEIYRDLLRKFLAVDTTTYTIANLAANAIHAARIFRVKQEQYP